MKFFICIFLALNSYAGEILCHSLFVKSINFERVEKAFILAQKYHAKQYRSFDGTPYINHPDRVAQSVLRHTDDEEMVIAAILHDVIEDTSMTLIEIRNKFGLRVAALVKELTSSPDQIAKLGKTEYLTRKLNTLSSDALTIKLLDRLDNLRDLKIAPPKWRTNYVNQTLKILNNLDRPMTELQKKLVTKIKTTIQQHKK